MEEKNRQPEVTIEGNVPAGKKKKKLVLAVEIILGIAVCAILCVMGAKVAEKMKVESNKAKYADASYVQQDILNYLKERYQEDFTLVENTYRGMGYAYDYVEVHAYPTVHQDEQHKFEVQGRYNEKGEMEYCDGYVMVQLAREYEQRIDEIIDETFDDYKFFLEFHSEWLTNNLPVGTTVDDLKNYRANADYPLPRLAVYMRPSQMEKFNQDSVEEVCSKLAELGYRGIIHVTCYEYDTHYEMKTRENMREAVGGEEDHWKYFVVHVNGDGSIDYRQGE